MKKRLTILLLVVVATSLTAISGCTSNHKQSATELRWEHTMEQARIDAARQSLAQGRFEYAKRVLQPCKNTEDVQKLMTEIQAAQQVYAQLSTYRNGTIN